MNLKIRDEKHNHRELEQEKRDVRHDIDVIFGKNSKKQRGLIKQLRQEARRTRTDEADKYEQKVWHLGRRKREEEQRKLTEVPKGLEYYKEAKVFDNEKYEQIQEDKVEIKMIGKAEVSECERSVLRLQPKFAVLRQLDTVEMKNDLELGFGKARYQLLAEINERLEAEGKEEQICELILQFSSCF